MKELMKKIFFLMLVVLFSQEMAAQPKARRAEQQAATAQKSNANNMTLRAQISFPTEQKMNEDVVWRRDVYREIKLEDEANSGLYYPTEPLGTQMNLFTYIFKLVMAVRVMVVSPPTHTMSTRAMSVSTRVCVSNR